LVSLILFLDLPALNRRISPPELTNNPGKITVQPS